MAPCNNSSAPPEIPVEGSIEAPRATSPRQTQPKPKKVYPPGPPGKVLIFRKWKTDPKTGQRIYAPPGKVFPMWVDP